MGAELEYECTWMPADGADEIAVVEEMEDAPMDGTSRHKATYERDMSKKARIKRIGNMLDIHNDDTIVKPEMVLALLEKRHKHKNPMSLQQVKEVIQELCQIRDKRNCALQLRNGGSNSFPEQVKSGAKPAIGSTSTSIKFKDFAEFIVQNDLDEKVNERKANDIYHIQCLFLAQDVREVIAKVTKTTPEDQETMAIIQAHLKKQTSTTMRILNLIVSVTVVMSITTYAISLDHWPGWRGWRFFEFFCCSIFVAEVGIKHKLIGWREYWFGPDKVWNWADFSITGISIADLCLMVFASQDELPAGKIAVMIRSVRVLRMVRLLKMLKAPGVRELVNMLHGFLLGIPCLFSLTLLLTTMFCVFGMAFREIVGPAAGTEDAVGSLQYCGGNADAPIADEACVQAELYGMEYFGTVTKSIFTTFRCIIGDCSSKGGQSLVGWLSSHWGIKFDLVYAFGMIVMLFGVFNVIIAIFLENTLNGLKCRDAKNAYEGKFVKKKMEDMMLIVKEWAKRTRASRNGMVDDIGDDDDWVGNLLLSEPEFRALMQDKRMAGILEDLDIHLINHQGLFELFELQTWFGLV
jgi:hypothetical protein